MDPKTIFFVLALFSWFLFAFLYFYWVLAVEPRAWDPATRYTEEMAAFDARQTKRKWFFILSGLLAVAFTVIHNLLPTCPC
jgi:hypothetical protein